MSSLKSLAAADGSPIRKGEAGTGQATLAAFLTDDGQSIDQGLVWHVFPEKPAADGQRKPIRSSKEPSPALRLPPGSYLVTVSFGRAHLTRRVTIAVGDEKTEAFVLNAGGIRVTATLPTGAPAPETSVAFDILSDERDQSGQRAKIMGAARPGLIIRLNAGLYNLVSTYGDANAVVRADVTVEAGKLTEVVVNHVGAKVTLKLVTRAGGEALAETQWQIANAQGETIKVSLGALPTHILAAGSYVATARYGGRDFKRPFKVKVGEATQVEVVMP